MDLRAGDGRASTGFICFRIRTAYGFRKMQVVSWLDEEILTFHKGLCSVEAVKCNKAICIYVRLETCYLPQVTNSVSDVYVVTWSLDNLRSYKKANEIHSFLKFVFGIELYVFRTISLSIIRCLALYTQQYGYADCLLASSQHNLCDIYLLLCADGAVHGTIRTVNTTHAAAVKTTTHPKTQCRKPYAATQHLMLLMMGVCTRNMSS